MDRREISESGEDEEQRLGDLRSERYGGSRRFLDQQDRRSIGTRGTDRCLRGRPIGRARLLRRRDEVVHESGFFVEDECAIRGGSRATELPKHASASARESQPRRAPSSV
ncbi:hypothetical protein WN48_00853 [Eufriesea mexicana]|nr:hypothetical protein WN48_00853 [Eufriesea mexicana]